MKQFITTVLVIALCAGTAAAADRPDEFYRERIDSLDLHLDAVQSKVKKSRLVSGGIELSLGVLLGGLGYHAIAGAGGSEDPELATLGGSMFLAGGAVLSGFGIGHVAIPSKAEKTYRKFSSYPEATSRELKLKAEKGERDFRDLADASKTGKIYSGGASLALGTAYILYSGSWLGALMIGDGLVSVIMPSNAEKEWSYYLEEIAGE